jgi:hypothetical protein
MGACIDHSFQRLGFPGWSDEGQWPVERTHVGHYPMP